jgi:hypothetical protein
MCCSGWRELVIAGGAWIYPFSFLWGNPRGVTLYKLLIFSILQFFMPAKYSFETGYRQNRHSKRVARG